MGKFVLNDIDKLTVDELLELGFRLWDEDAGALYLIPLGLYTSLPDGTVLTSIFGDTKIKGDDLIDLDTRFGVIAWGIDKS